MRFAELVATSRAVAETSGRLEKIGHLASFLKRLPPDEIEMAAAFLSGSPRQGSIGIGGAALTAARRVQPAGSSTLGLRHVDAAFDRIGTAHGAGASQARARNLRDLFERATRA